MTVVYRHYNSEHNNSILLNPPIQFRHQSTYSSWACPYFAAIHHFRLSLLYILKKFCYKGIFWWNALPHELLDKSPLCVNFKWPLYGHLLSIIDWL